MIITVTNRYNKTFVVNTKYIVSMHINECGWYDGWGEPYDVIITLNNSPEIRIGCRNKDIAENELYELRNSMAKESDDDES